MALLSQLGGQMAPDKAVASRDQGSHPRTLVVRGYYQIPGEEGNPDPGLEILRDFLPACRFTSAFFRRRD
jgi:hypothetical protein